MWGEGNWATETSLVHPLVGQGRDQGWEHLPWPGSDGITSNPWDHGPNLGTTSLGNALGFGEGGAWIGGMV